MNPWTNIAAALILLTVFTPAHAQQTTPRCTADTRACMLEAVASYYDAMRHHDGSRAWLAPAVRRTLQAGIPQGNGEDPLCLNEQEVRASLDKAPAQTHLDERFLVDEPNHGVVAFVLLTLKDQPVSIHVTERFKIEKGLITEIEAIFLMDKTTADGKTGWPMSMPE